VRLANRFVQIFANCREFDTLVAANHFCFQPLGIGISIARVLAPDANSTRSAMLRITRDANGEVVFRVSGQLTADNVAEMEQLLSAETKRKPIVVDCVDLNSVDGEAIRRLEKWESESIKLKNCSLYIREWIRRTRRERKSAKNPET
jgi:anti-anti-sigma regulatory factor